MMRRDTDLIERWLEWYGFNVIQDTMGIDVKAGKDIQAVIAGQSIGR